MHSHRKTSQRFLHIRAPGSGRLRLPVRHMERREEVGRGLSDFMRDGVA